MIVVEKAAFNKKKVSTSKLDLNLRKKLVKCYIWSVALCGTEIWTLWKVDQKYLGSFEMQCWGRTLKSSWTSRMRHKEVLHNVEEQRNVLQTIERKEKLTGVFTCCIGTAF